MIFRVYEQQSEREGAQYVGDGRSNDVPDGEGGPLADDRDDDYSELANW